MSPVHDGATSTHFRALSINGSLSPENLTFSGMSNAMRRMRTRAPRGKQTAWGISFHIQKLLVAHRKPITITLTPQKSGWFIFQHTTDILSHDAETGASGFISPMRGEGKLAEPAADYVMLYQDGSEVRVPIRRRYEIGTFQRRWGENCVAAVTHRKPCAVSAAHEQATKGWGESQTRVAKRDLGGWQNWLWAWENPHPKKAIVGVRIEPRSGAIILAGIAAGNAEGNPLRWCARRKALLTLPRGQQFDPTLDDNGGLRQLQLDLGQVISATPQFVYPNATWQKSSPFAVPETPAGKIIVEYTAHPDACFQLGKKRISVRQLEAKGSAGTLRVIAPAAQKITLRTIDKATRLPVPVKLHIHGEASEYLTPTDRHRIPNPGWFEDYGAEQVHAGTHYNTYIAGEADLRLPLGKVYIEVSKGFEIRPIRKVVRVNRKTTEIVIELEKVLPWREKGWVTADTHVHFLSPQTAVLEGAAEGVNVINLLASQWGELMTNAGDFDGKTTFGEKAFGGDGEYLVRVGSENRQHVMGHISLLGYSGNLITPMCSGGTNEAALGDPVEVLLTEWARQCQQQRGLVVLPHFPQPRCELAATIVDESADAVEMCSHHNMYGGIDPYSLSDWYRYLNCGYLLPAVGGTDKMSAATAVGTIRTYARIARDTAFQYASWMDAVRGKETFVSYGPLLEFSVEGQTMGSHIHLPKSGGTVDVSWNVASVTVPMTRVELVVNGEVVEGKRINRKAASGNWRVSVERSSWLALLVRGHYPEQTEMIAAHSTPVMVEVKNSPFYAAADAVTILEQIEGALAYLEITGVRADDKAYKRMRLVLESAHRKLHTRMHERGHYHDHTHSQQHTEHQ